MAIDEMTSAFEGVRASTVLSSDPSAAGRMAPAALCVNDLRQVLACVPDSGDEDPDHEDAGHEPPPGAVLDPPPVHAAPDKKKRWTWLAINAESSDTVPIMTKGTTANCWNGSLMNTVFPWSTEVRSTMAGTPMPHGVTMPITPREGGSARSLVPCP